MTVAQASVIVLLSSTGQPRPISEIGRMLMQESQSTTTLIDRMCAKGLVERIKDPRNRHAVLVRMTDEGARMCEMVGTSLPPFTDEMFNVLSSEDRVALEELLWRFVERNIERLQ